MFDYTHRCDRCSQIARVVFARFLCYRLDDGTEITWTDQPVWCLDCRCVSAAEALPEAAWLAEMLQRVEERGIDNDDREGAKFLGRDASTIHSEEVQQWRVKLRWRIARRSPPRCLKCGSLTFQPLSLAQDGSFEHPGCAGRFHTVLCAHACQGKRQVLTSEGLPWSEDDRLSEDWLCKFAHLPFESERNH
jgi:hypothetical protein